jgi:hypothetical protein
MKKHDIVPAHLAVVAMRDNGYKNAAYAIAELMDNSIQAGATQVELLCGEKKEIVSQRKRSRIQQLAVLDNGCGMNEAVLRLALQFGNGTYLDEDKHTGIGRFGMGLPSSSVSQCQRVDVWSWQKGPESALYTYLDLQEIKQKKITEVPEPVQQQIPFIWRRVGKAFGQTGTLVVWSDIDRCIWKTGSAIIDNSEFLIGRMYRYFLNDGQVNIRMTAFDLDNPQDLILEKLAKPNDPMYLMPVTSCPNPYDKEPMFQAWEADEADTITFQISFREQVHPVKVRFSYAKEEARLKPNAGATPYGRHAAKNLGVSIVRAQRELELDNTLVNTYDPTERWWGVEVDFPPSLDDLFGVTNNKQYARNFTELIKTDIEALMKERNKGTISELKEELQREEDPRGPLLDVTEKIKSQLKIIRGLLKAQTRGTRGGSKRHDETHAEQVATKVTEARKKDGYIGESDKDESKPLEVRQQEIIDTLTQEGVAESQAQSLAAKTISDGLKYTFTEASLETAAFFSVKPKGGAIIVTLNTQHPAYKNLVEILEEDVENADIDELKSRLSNSLEGLKLLLMAWARFEDEQPDGRRRQAAQDTRVDWGRMARQFLEGEE